MNQPAASLLTACVLATTAACSSVDRLAMTEFRPKANGFVYKVAADGFHPESSPGAEAERIGSKSTSPITASARPATGL
jgi:hypothetical protein